MAEVLFGGLTAFASITQMMKRFGLTARAIRFYEERGLIEASRDRQNWRRYDRKAQARLGIIALCRHAGLSLTEVGEILALDGESAALERRIARQKLAKRLEALEQARNSVEKLMVALDGAAADGFAERPQALDRQHLNRLRA